MKKVLVPLVLVLVAILLFTGCGGGKTTTTTSTSTKTTTSTTSTTSTTATTTSTSAIKTGGTLRILASVSPSSMPGWPGDATNPQKAWDYCIVFEGLVKIDINGQPNPWLATDWKFGPNNAYIDFNLRKGVKFHDGTNFTADSVITHINQLVTDKDSSVTYMGKVEKTGDYSVRINITKFRNDFWTNLVGSWSMMFTSDTQLKEKGLDYVKAHPCGTGPFMLESYEKDVSQKFVKNPNYWQPGKPYLDSIEYIVVKETLTSQAKMEANEADVMSMQSDGKVITELGDKGMVVKNVINQAWFLDFDTANEAQPTSNPKVRIALEYALNKQEMADALGAGVMFPTNQLAGPDASSFAYNPNLATREYNPTKAKQLLTEAGYPDGFTMNLIAADNPTIRGTAVMVQNYLKAIGVTVTIDALDNAKMWNYLFTGWTGGFVICFGMQASLATLVSNTFPPWAQYNTSIKLPQDIIDLTNAAMVETDTAKFKTMNMQLSQLIWDNAFVIPTTAFGNAYIYQPYVKDYDCLNWIDWPFWSPEKVWLDR
jgi:peptide/nickel transport system substrate-binding protein